MDSICHNQLNNINDNPACVICVVCVNLLNDLFKSSPYKALYLIALAHPNASLDGVCGTIWAQRERSCKVQTSSRVLSIEGDAFDVVEFEE